MHTKVRVLGVVMVLVVAQLMPGVAIARDKRDALGLQELPKMSCALTPTGVEPNASGRARLTDATYDPLYPSPNSWGTLSLTCTGLTPDAQYSTPVGLVTADARGRLNASGTYNFNWPGSWVVVCNAKGEVVLEGVLQYLV